MNSANISFPMEQMKDLRYEATLKDPESTWWKKRKCIYDMHKKNECLTKDNTQRIEAGYLCFFSLQFGHSIHSLKQTLVIYRISKKHTELILFYTLPWASDHSINYIYGFTSCTCLHLEGLMRQKISIQTQEGIKMAGCTHNAIWPFHTLLKINISNLQND